MNTAVATPSQTQAPVSQDDRKHLFGPVIDFMGLGGLSLIALALRYMHTTVEMAHKDDVEGVIKLIYETLQQIDGGMSFKYFEV